MSLSLSGAYFYLIGNSFGISLLNKTLREDAQLAEGKFELRSHSRAKESQATLCSINQILIYFTYIINI